MIHCGGGRGGQSYFGNTRLNRELFKKGLPYLGLANICEVKHFGQGALGVFGVKHQFLLDKVGKGPNGPEMVPNES